jgi:Zn-dependent protease
MFRSWRLGKVFGIGIYVHWTFLLLVAYVLLSNWGESGPHTALFAVWLLLSVFTCVVLHELGHALMARRFGIPTRDITLYPIGGVARLQRMSERPWEEFWIAVAGPAVNVAIAGLLFILLTFLGLSLDSQGELLVTALGSGYLFTLALINLGLVAFYLVPAFPMDGGRVLRAVLVPALGRLRATETAANIGAFFAILLLLAGIWNPMLILVGAFVFLAGRHELWAVRQQENARRAEPLDVLPVAEDIQDVIPAPDRPPVSPQSWDPKPKAWVMWSNGQRWGIFRIE